jgi:hypothetical protein
MGMSKTFTALSTTLKNDVLFLNVKHNVILMKHIHTQAVRCISVYNRGPLYTSVHHVTPPVALPQLFHSVPTWYIPRKLSNSVLYSLLYPIVPLGVTALACSSCASQKMAAPYEIIISWHTGCNNNVSCMLGNTNWIWSHHWKGWSSLTSPLHQVCIHEGHHQLLNSWM